MPIYIKKKSVNIVLENEKKKQSNKRKVSYIRPRLQFQLRSYNIYNNWWIAHIIYNYYL